MKQFNTLLHQAEVAWDEYTSSIWFIYSIPFIVGIIIQAVLLCCGIS